MTSNPIADWSWQRLEQTAVGQLLTVEEVELLVGAPVPACGRLVGGILRFALAPDLRLAAKEPDPSATIEILEMVFQAERWIPPNYADSDVWPEPCRLLRWRRVR